MPTSVDTLLMATRHLHRTGDLFFSEQQGLLKDIVILDMAWLGQDLLGWLHCPTFMLAAHQRQDWIRFQRMAAEGPVPLSLIPVPDIVLLPAKASLDVLEHFAQCYSFEDSASVDCGCPTMMYVFPSLLKTSKPAHVWTGNDQFNVHIGLKLSCSDDRTMLPAGLFARMQVHLRQEIGPKFSVDVSSRPKASPIWQGGIWLSDDVCEAIVVLSSSSQSIYVCVRGDGGQGSQCRSLLSRIQAVITQHCHMHSPGLSLLIEYSSASQLKQGILEADVYSHSQIEEARRAGSNRVRHSKGFRDSINSIFGYEEGQGRFHCV